MKIADEYLLLMFEDMTDDQLLRLVMKSVKIENGYAHYTHFLDTLLNIASRQPEKQKKLMRVIDQVYKKGMKALRDHEKKKKKNS